MFRLTLVFCLTCQMLTLIGLLIKVCLFVCLFFCLFGFFFLLLNDWSPI